MTCWALTHQTHFGILNIFGSSEKDHNRALRKKKKLYAFKRIKLELEIHRSPSNPGEIVALNTDQTSWQGFCDYFLKIVWKQKC